MITNPILSAFAASGYIGAIVLIANTFQKLFGSVPDNSVLDPMIALSLFVLSASVMGYLFLGQPLMLYFDGHKKEALTYFFKTVVTFAVITLVFVVLLVLIK